MPLVYDDGTVETMPVVHAGEKIASLLFGSVESLRTLVSRMDSLSLPQSFDFTKDIKISDFTVTFVTKKTPVKNVMGIIKGAKSKGEYIVIGAHYDHVGFSRPQSKQKDSIFNGADDNASGTTGLLLLAQSMATIADELQRDIVFVAFSGEEKGLYGSRAFVETSPLPLQQCVAMFNMDMIGRNDSNTLSVGGNSRCPELAELNEKENQKNVQSVYYQI
jgi:Zn-dependent M28 family amino/carboxypeptidase